LSTAAAVEWENHLSRLAKDHSALFWRYERGGAALGGKPVAAVHPATTSIVTLGDEAAMFAALKPKWRYNIGLAGRKGVTIRQSAHARDVAEFYNLLQKTASRQGIALHPQQYYETMAATLAGSLITYYFADYQDRVIATALVARFHDTVTYVHGGADYADRAVMAPHLLHWQIMCDAATAGYKYYDLFGVAPTDQPNHPWAGITQFKLGFGGSTVEYPGTFERALQPAWYTLYKLIKRTRLWTS
jgi:lipid II:glycine glycyltransferase (peptidoglycan interpeptide bridge formation enzyme)